MKKTANENLMQIRELLKSIEKDDYTRKTEILSDASIGQHIRHILEFYILLVSGSFSGIISYDKRERDMRIETNPDFAIETINRLMKGMETLDVDFLLKLEGDFTSDGSSKKNIQSSVGRELAYCIEHSIRNQ